MCCIASHTHLLRSIADREKSSPFGIFPQETGGHGLKAKRRGPAVSWEMDSSPYSSIMMQTLNASQGASAFQHLIQHLFGEPAGEGVLLAGMVAAEQHVRAHTGFLAVAE